MNKEPRCLNPHCVVCKGDPETVSKDSRIKGFWKGKDLYKIVTDSLDDSPSRELALSLALSDVMQDVIIEWGDGLGDTVESEKAWAHLGKAIAWARLAGLSRP